MAGAFTLIGILVTALVKIALDVAVLKSSQRKKAEDDKRLDDHRPSLWD